MPPHRKCWSTRFARAFWRRSWAIQSFWLTEHHFQPEGAEISPNPLFTQMAIAAQTRKIRLGQCANIVVWHHPVRIAEQIAQLDVISGGRVECGMGRGYQPRENETLGRPYGSTIQDQERNRKSFEEAVAIIRKCWTEPSFVHRGENFSIPPSYTKWNHKQTIAYFQMDKVERRLEDVIAIGAPDMYSAGNPVQATTTTLKELQVFPQPVQKPHPQIWEPLTSPRLRAVDRARRVQRGGPSRQMKPQPPPSSLSASTSSFLPLLQRQVHRVVVRAHDAEERRVAEVLRAPPAVQDLPVQEDAHLVAVAERELLHLGPVGDDRGPRVHDLHPRLRIEPLREVALAKLTRGMRAPR